MKENPIRRPQSTRRQFLKGLGLTVARGIVVLASPFLLPKTSSADPAQKKFAYSSDRLEKSAFAYITPLKAKGEESTCHAELWYGWLDESVVVIVSTSGWKARALEHGFDRARVWIGDHGRWRGWLGTRNETFRRSPAFDARVERIDSSEKLDQLLALYEKKYPAEIASWREPMRSGFRDGTRVVLRYTPTRETDPA